MKQASYFPLWIFEVVRFEIVGQFLSRVPSVFAFGTETARMFVQRLGGVFILIDLIERCLLMNLRIIESKGLELELLSAHPVMLIFRATSISSQKKARCS